VSDDDTPKSPRGRFTDIPDADAWEFTKAMNRWMKANRCQFPKWSDVLKVVRELGYMKVTPEIDNSNG
jgi:hypothetical protein